MSNKNRDIATTILSAITGDMPYTHNHLCHLLLDTPEEFNTAESRIILHMIWQLGMAMGGRIYKLQEELEDIRTIKENAANKSWLLKTIMD